MDYSDIFRKKLDDLNSDELQYTAEYFERTYGKKAPVGADAADLIREGSHKKPHHSMAQNTYSGKQIDHTWLDGDANALEGELAVDIFQTDEAVFITSTVAGVKSEDLDIDLNGDMITIRGIRKPAFTEIEDTQFLVRECYWGGFSRSVILPSDIQYDKVKATLENGILTIILPKSPHAKIGKIAVEEK